MKKFLSAALIIFLLLFSCACFPVSQDTAAEIHFIDVGQADSILILSGDFAVLIDAGTNSAGEEVLKYIKEQDVSKIDYLIGTHPHEDHIGGLDTVIEGLDIGEIIMPRHSSNTQTYEDVLLTAQNKGLKITAAQAGNSFTAGECSFYILAPDGEYSNTNNYSVVMRMTVGNVSVLFTGDAESQSEERMLESGAQLKSDLLKIGHHGSDTSTSDQFLQAVSPKYAVISVGENNSYGHPSSQTLEKLSGIELYRTDLMGTIIASTDGKEITFSTENGSIPPTAKPAQTASIQTAPAPSPITSPITASPELTTRPAPSESPSVIYIGNKNTLKFHLPTCSGLPEEANRIIFNSREEAVQAGMTPCARCNP